MQKTSINPQILQSMLECAANAATVGQSQFFTPLAFGRHCATALPKVRPFLVDLNCGAGHLLHASAPPSGARLLGADIDPCDGNIPRLRDPDTLQARAAIRDDRLTSCITRLLPVLSEINFTADAFTLNPPWRLYFHRHLFPDLEQSELLAVREAFQGLEDGAPKGTIDSTAAMLLAALHLCSDRGEGFLIANNNTLQRLFFYPNSPHQALRQHCWLRLVVPGNPMTGLDHANFQDPAGEDEDLVGGSFKTGVLYFARDHTAGPREFEFPSLAAFLQADLQSYREWRGGAEVRADFNCQRDTVDLWTVARQHLAELNGRKPRVPFNLWLDADGQIRTDLSRFEKASLKIAKRNLKQLFELNGKSPMQLVLQRASREMLLELAERSGWRVSPTLLAAVHQAIREYHSERAPLYPLGETQRLGYLDEESLIECKADLNGLFAAGRKYPLRSQSVKVERTVRRPNSMTGQDEDLEYTGQELAFFIDDVPIADPSELATYTPGREYSFMDARLLTDQNTEIADVRRLPKGVNRGALPPVDFSLEQLCHHFIIPQVPDVATMDPAGYARNLQLLEELEQLTDQLAPAGQVVVAA